MKHKHVILFSLLVSLGFVVPAFSANWYVARGATGSNNGTNWTNAWNELNQIKFSSVACGDTIWVAGGNYTTSMSISKTCTASTVLMIRRVLSTDSVPVAAAGWQSSFDSQVVVTNGTVTLAGGAYYTIDGRVGDARTLVPYGMQWAYTGNGNTAFSNTSTTISNVTMTHIELWGSACVASGSCTDNSWGLNLNQGTDNYTLVDHCWFHRFAEVIRPYLTNNMTIQYSYIGEDDAVTPADHEDLIYAAPSMSNLTLANNVWYDSGNDGIFMDYGGISGVTIYNNIFYQIGGWAISFGKTGTCGPYVVYNNIFQSDGTFGEYPYSWIGTGGCTVASGTDIANNIFYNTSPDSGGLSSSESYNAATKANGSNPPSCTGCFTYSLASPLTAFAGWVNMAPSNIITADFHLTASGATLFQGKGKNLTSLCTTIPGLCKDKDGNARPTSGGWTLGPYEYVSGTPTQPSGLTAAPH